MEQFVVSARKYRPQAFEAVVGQSHITDTLLKSVENDHLAQALLFCGPRGVGKTTCARILAKVINAGANLSDDELALNIFELDAASNNSVDDIRRLIDQVRFAPQTGKFKVYIIDDPAPNAFATGRNPENAVVAATTGLLDIMDKNELEGVMAHELGHVKNYDIRVSTLVFGLVSAIGILADIAIRMAWYSSFTRNRNNGQMMAFLVVIGVVGWIIAWLIGPLVSAAVSRQREYLADASGVEMTRYPDGLASALQKLGEYGKPMKRANTAMAHMYINDPLKPGLVERVFSTHPPIPKRVERLSQIGRGF